MAMLARISGQTHYFVDKSPGLCQWSIARLWINAPHLSGRASPHVHSIADWLRPGSSAHGLRVC